MKSHGCNCWSCTPSKEKKAALREKEIRSVKSQLVKRTGEELRASRCGAYEYLLP